MRGFACELCSVFGPFPPRQVEPGNDTDPSKCYMYNLKALSFKRTSMTNSKCKWCEKPKKEHFEINGRFVCRNCCVCARLHRGWQKQAGTTFPKKLICQIQDFGTYACMHCRSRDQSNVGPQHPESAAARQTWNAGGATWNAGGATWNSGGAAVSGLGDATASGAVASNVDLRDGPSAGARRNEDEAGGGRLSGDDDDQELQRALAVSRRGGNRDDEDQDLQRALAASRGSTVEANAGAQEQEQDAHLRAAIQASLSTLPPAPEQPPQAPRAPPTNPTAPVPRVGGGGTAAATRPAHAPPPPPSTQPPARQTSAHPVTTGRVPPVLPARPAQLSSVAVPQGPAVDLYTRECVICLDRPRHVRFQCGHSTLCQECLESFLEQAAPKCPTCREPISRNAVVSGTHVAVEESYIRPALPA